MRNLRQKNGLRVKKKKKLCILLQALHVERSQLHINTTEKRKNRQENEKKPRKGGKLAYKIT